jgi:hypothetical protein
MTGAATDRNGISHSHFDVCARAGVRGTKDHIAMDQHLSGIGDVWRKDSGEAVGRFNYHLERRRDHGTDRWVTEGFIDLDVATARRVHRERTKLVLRLMGGRLVDFSVAPVSREAASVEVVVDGDLYAPATGETNTAPEVRKTVPRRAALPSPKPPLPARTQAPPSTPTRQPASTVTSTEVAAVTIDRCFDRSVQRVVSAIQKAIILRHKYERTSVSQAAEFRSHVVQLASELRRAGEELSKTTREASSH